MANGNIITKHHLKPTSRLTEEEKRRNHGIQNIGFWYDLFHKAYHIIFGNLTLRESHLFLDTVNIPDGKRWTFHKLEDSRSDIKDLDIDRKIAQELSPLERKLFKVNEIAESWDKRQEKT